jgi:hypothetical protein
LRNIPDNYLENYLIPATFRDMLIIAYENYLIGARFSDMLITAFEKYLIAAALMDMPDNYYLVTAT